MAYHTGMRRQEILSLQWERVDLMEGRINLKPQDTKNKESRVIYLQGELLEVIHFQRSLRDSKFPDCPLVFFNQEGKKIGNFRKSWGQACKEVGLEGRLLHDFRRTAVRNMIRAGVPERVAMTISGQKTRDIFDRYNIVNEDDLRRASQKVKQYHEAKLVEREMIRGLADGHNLGTIKTDSQQNATPGIH